MKTAHQTPVSCISANPWPPIAKSLGPAAAEYVGPCPLQLARQALQNSLVPKCQPSRAQYRRPPGGPNLSIFACHSLSNAWGSKIPNVSRQTNSFQQAPTTPPPPPTCACHMLMSLPLPDRSLQLPPPSCHNTCSPSAYRQGAKRTVLHSQIYSWRQYLGTLSRSITNAHSVLRTTPTCQENAQPQPTKLTYKCRSAAAHHTLPAPAVWDTCPAPACHSTQG